MAAKKKTTKKAAKKKVSKASKKKSSLEDLQNFTTKLKVKAHTSAIWAVAFSPDSQTAFTAGSDQIIREWDLSNGESISP